MPRFLFLFLLFAPCFACQKDYRYDFANIPLQGQIEGHDWFYEYGALRWEGDSVRVRLYTDSFSNILVCNDMDSLPAIGYGDMLEFKLPLGGLEDLYYLHFDFKKYRGIVVNFYSQEKNINNIATEGAIEITRWDAANGKLYGQMDICYNKTTFCNGQFEASLCP